jgi:ribonuclease HI
MLEQKEANDRLDAINEMIDQHIESNAPILTYSQKLLENIQAIAQGGEVPEPPPLKVRRDVVVISCDASIKENPGGPASVGVVIEYPHKPSYSFAQGTVATTSNQAEYDAVYIGLTTLMGLQNNPGCLLEVRSDSKLIVDQLNGDMRCNDANLQRRRDSILELASALPVPVKFMWRPRNSTPALMRANFLAQDKLEVPRH